MMEQKITKLNDWFAAQIGLCEQRGQALLADDRADEASFEKVRANVSVSYTHLTLPTILRV